jgi:glycosyltransferase involved in cell wall biosynthesis
MTKILLISYFYPPANFVGGDRTASWAKYLHESGYYPIVITRQWNDGQTDLVDKLENNHLEVEYNETYEVHHLPYKRSLRDRCSTYKWLKPLQKALTLYELIASNFFIRALPYANFYAYSKNLLKEDPTITIVIASGRPFQSFFIGYKLKKDFPAIHWIPDYRDEWTSFQHRQSMSFVHKVLHPIDQIAEKRWVSNSTFFIAVSDAWASSISKLVNKKGIVVHNGFIPSEPLKPSDEKDNLLVLAFVGTLYPNQRVELVLEAIVSMQTTKIKVCFYGMDISQNQQKRFKSFDSICIEYYPRLPKRNLLDTLSNVDVFFLSGFDGIKGWYPVKLFDYFNWGRPILLCPSDNDVMEQFIKETGSGFIANTVEECQVILYRLINVKERNESLHLKRNIEAGNKYSRRNQTAILAKHLSSLSHDN